jgi:hypothetical protein
MIFPLRSRSPPRPIFFAAERAEDKRMATYVYDYPSGSTASFYIDGEYVFPMSGAAPATGTTGIPTHQLVLQHFR